MLRIRVLLLLSVVLLALFVVVPRHLTADDATPANDGWISLFNGKDLTGWKASEGVTWTVEDGKIVTPPQRSHLFSEQKFKNFEFKAEVMTTPGSNSGIYFHTEPEETWPSHGYESQVNVTHGDPVKTGSLYNVVKLYETPATDTYWWTQQITVKGKNIVVRINGKVVVDYTEPEGVTGPRRLNPEGGNFALQAHDPRSKVFYRNIQIRKLPD